MRIIAPHTAWDGDPAFSPDGKLLAFRTHRDGNIGVYVRGRNRELRNVSANWDWNEPPAWAPHGLRLAHASSPAGNREIMVADLETGAVANITNASSNEWCPRWSPDGKKIAFLSDRGGELRLYVANADGSGPVEVSGGPVLDVPCSWRPEP